MWRKRIVIATALLAASQKVVVRFFERIHSSEKAVNYSEDKHFIAVVIVRIWGEKGEGAGVKMHQKKIKSFLIF